MVEAVIKFSKKISNQIDVIRDFIEQWDKVSVKRLGVNVIITYFTDYDVHIDIKQVGNFTVEPEKLLIVMVARLDGKMRETYHFGVENNYIIEEGTND